MRDTMIHSYDDTDLGEAWQAIQRGVPQLLDQTNPLIPDAPE
jgi:uncharacterized protein with HEPN domain